MSTAKKQMYIMRGTKEESYTSFKDRIMAICNSILNDVKGLTVTITCDAPPCVSIIPFRNQKIAVISAYVNKDNYISQILEDNSLKGCYTVDEAFPAKYDKTWQDGEPTPGVCLLTLISKKHGLTYDYFLKRWHDGHSPLTLKIHPVYHYNRNTIVSKNESLNCEKHDGIIEEHTKTRSILLNPFKFFGNPINMIRVLVDVRAFIEYSTIETYLTNEYWLKSVTDN